jgi:hypothetical protein
LPGYARKIEIKSGQIKATAELNDTSTAAEIWSDELYFGIPLKMGLENGGARVLLSRLDE